MIAESAEELRTPSPGVPRFARWLDIATLVGLGLAFLVPVFGAIRLRFDWLSLSVQSPWRALLVALAAAGLRHALVRHPHLLSRVRDGWRDRWRDPALREAATVYTVIRLPVLVTALFAVFIVGYPADRVIQMRASTNEFVNLPVRWDAGWYLGITLEGYAYDPGAEGQQNIAFFPAYPMLMRTGAALLGAFQPVPVGGGNLAEVERRTKERTVAAGWLVSLAGGLWALVYLFRFARETLGEQAASGSVWLLSAYPFAYFFGALYTESLFLLGVVATFYHFRRHEHLPAMAWGLLVGLTRPNGCLLSVPLGLMALQQAFLPRTLGAADPPARAGWASFARMFGTAAMPGIGMLVFSGWLWTFTSQPLAWMQAHQAWGRTFQGVDGLIASRVSQIAGEGFYRYISTRPIEALYVAALVGSLAAVWPVARRMGIAFAALILLTVLPPLFAGGLLSMGRITGTIFPLFVYLGWRLSPPTTTRLAIAWMSLQGLLAAAFFTWREVF